MYISPKYTVALRTRMTFTAFKMALEAAGVDTKSKAWIEASREFRKYLLTATYPPITMETEAAYREAVTVVFRECLLGAQGSCDFVFYFQGVYDARRREYFNEFQSTADNDKVGDADKETLYASLQTLRDSVVSQLDNLLSTKK